MNSIVNALGKLVAPCGLALAFFAPMASTQAGAYQVLHTFSGQPNGDGAEPWAAPITDGAGNLYGTTIAGGANNWGTVFKIASDGTETVLYNFCGKGKCSDGQLPHDGVIMDQLDNLYGTATYGGDAAGQGVVFKLAPDGTETILYDFQGSPNDGQYPYGGLLMDKSGNLYGTTVAGGPDNDGTVFKLAPDGTETVLHSFTNSSSDGNEPMGSLVSDKSGNLYGSTFFGGANNDGAVFKLAPDGTEKVLRSFCVEPNCNGGAWPEAGPTLDTAGNLYGTTSQSGKYGDGTVFRLKK